MYIVLTSLLSSLFIGIFGNIIGRQAAILVLLILFVLSIIINYEMLLCQNIINIDFYNLLKVNDISLNFHDK